MGGWVGCGLSGLIDISMLTDPIKASWTHRVMDGLLTGSLTDPTPNLQHPTHPTPQRRISGRAGAGGRVHDGQDRWDALPGLPRQPRRPPALPALRRPGGARPPPGACVRACVKGVGSCVGVVRARFLQPRRNPINSPAQPIYPPTRTPEFRRGRSGSSSSKGSRGSRSRRSSSRRAATSARRTDRFIE